MLSAIQVKGRRWPNNRSLVTVLTVALALSNPLTAKAELLKISPKLEVSSLALNANSRHSGVIGADNRHPLKWGETVIIPDGTRGSITSSGEFISPSIGAGMERSDFSTKRIVRLLTKNMQFVCTGAVVAPTIVLTAAHCLRWNGKWLRDPLRPVYVEAWNGQIFEVRSKRSRSVSDGYKGSPLPNSPRSTTADQWSLDAGLLYLSKSIASVTDGFLEITDFDGKGTLHFSLVGFHGDVESEKPKQLVIESAFSSDSTSRSRSCWGYPRGIAERGRRGRKDGSFWHGYGTVITHKCDSSPGSSGSPLLLKSLFDPGDEFKIAGVHVANGGGGALAVNLGEDANEGGPFDWIRRRVADDRENYGWRKDDSGVWQGVNDAPWRNP